MKGGASLGSVGSLAHNNIHNTRATYLFAVAEYAITEEHGEQNGHVGPVLRACRDESGNPQHVGHGARELHDEEPELADLDLLQGIPAPFLPLLVCLLVSEPKPRLLVHKVLTIVIIVGHGMRRGLIAVGQ